MATPKQKVYDKFLIQIQDLRLPKLSQEELNSYFNHLLEASISEFTDVCKQDLTYNETEFISDLTLKEIMILSYGMVLFWIEPKMKSEKLLRQSIGDRDYKLSSNWQTLNQLIQLEAVTRQQLESEIVMYSYSNMRKK